MNQEKLERYLSSDIIAYDGMAFLAVLFSEHEYRKAKERMPDIVTLQISMNHVHLIEIEEDYEKGLEIAIQLLKEWTKKLNEKFPDKINVVQIVNINGQEWRVEFFIRMRRNGVKPKEYTLQRDDEHDTFDAWQDS